jgi:signal peptidase
MLRDFISLADDPYPSWVKWFRRVVSVADMILSSVVIWMAFVITCRNNMPLVVVLSNSMYPEFQRGDLLLAVGPPWGTPGEMFPNGQICGYNTKASDVPIVHRMIETHRHQGRGQILTKGDANEVADHWLYEGRQTFYRNEEVENKMVALLPTLGWMSILVKEDKKVSIVFIA